MDKKIQFLINKNKLYLEEVLVEFDIPLFFVCKDDSNNKYIVECIDEHKLEYIVSDTTNKDILDMLNKRCTMYDYIKRGKKYWKVITGENIETDDIEEINELTDDILPVKDAYYEHLSEKIKNYMKKLENE